MVCSSARSEITSILGLEWELRDLTSSAPDPHRPALRTAKTCAYRSLPGRAVSSSVWSLGWPEPQARAWPRRHGGGRQKSRAGTQDWCEARPELWGQSPTECAGHNTPDQPISWISPEGVSRRPRGQLQSAWRKLPAPG